MNRFLAIILLLIVGACKQDAPGEYDPSGQDTDGYDSLHFSYQQTGLRGPFLGVYFTDANNGYLAGYEGAICHTTDGGLSWKAQVTPTIQTLYDIYFLDSQEGFAVGGKQGMSVMLHTKDGGATWENIVLPTSVKATLYSICFADDMTGFAVGEQSILSTHNRGLSWEEAILTELQGTMYDVEFADAQKGLIGCSMGKVVRTTDGGKHWTITAPFDDTQWYRLSKVDDHTVFIAGRSYIGKSEDFGESWTSLPANPGTIYTLHFNNSKVGFAFGSGNYSGGDFGHYYGSIYYTRDGGATWTVDKMLTPISLIDASYFPTPDVGYAVGGNVVMKVERKK